MIIAALAILTLANLLLAFYLISSILSAFYGAPYVPLSKKEVTRVVKLLPISKGQLVYDLGSGDGRVVLAIAKDQAVKAVGVERSFWPYIIAKLKRQRTRLTGEVEFKRANFFDEDLSQADLVFCYLMPRPMERLKSKFERELKPNTMVASYAFKIPGWTPMRVDKPNAKSASIFIYRVT